MASKVRVVSILIYLFLYLPNVHAGSDSPLNPLFNMPLEKLLSISVVSKVRESVVVSPGIVTSYEADQLVEMGLSSLRDFMHFVPGLEFNEQLNQLALVQIRGLPAATNQKLLFLLNGVPYWMPENGDFPLHGIPIKAIERIEVIRGPGSVVYGTNASEGVINVITRREMASDFRLRVNNEALKSGSAFHGQEVSEGLSYQLAAEVQRGGKYQYAVENAIALDLTSTADGRLTQKREHESFFASAEYLQAKFLLHTYRSREWGDVNVSTVTPSLLEAEGTLLSFNFTEKFQYGEVELFSDWNRYYREVKSQDGLQFFGLDSPIAYVFDDSGKNNTRFRHGFSAHYRFTDTIKILLGAEYEERRTENKKLIDKQSGAVFNTITIFPFTVVTLQPDGSFLLIEEDAVYEKAGFMQLDSSYGYWRFILGARYVDNSGAGNDISPRGSVIYSLNENESLKILYSEGFNSPTFGQSASTDSFGVPQNNEVSAEIVKTWDLAYTRSKDHTHQVFSFFHAEVEDLITTNSNSQELFKRNGLEYELKYLEQDWTWLLGLSYVREGAGRGSDDASEFASNWLLKSGASYRWHEHQIGGSLRSAGQRQNVGAYHLLNLSYKYQATERLSSFVLLENVLDDQFDTPELRNGRSLVIEGHDGLGVTLGLDYKLGAL